MDYKTYRKYNYHTKKSTEYLNIECSFDIETTSTYYDDEKIAFMYLWGFGLGTSNNLLYYGRTWTEFLDFLQILANELNLSENRVLICYVHNLGYEFQFMRKYFDWIKIFAVDERKPIKALCSLGIEFRDSYILSGYSLEYTAKNLQNHSIDKMIGDLDYSLIRHDETLITDTELGYLENDIKIILYYINEQIEQYGKITKIPLTNTGRVRDYVRKNCYYSKNKSTYKSSKGKQKNYREIMENLTLENIEYSKLKFAFMGGFTHANAQYTNKLVSNVHSVDFTSSYPSVILSNRFPMGRGFTPSKDEILKNGYDYYIENFCCLIGVSYHGLKNKICYESYISESKCKIKGDKLIDNGRVFKAEHLATYITDIDYWIMDRCYTYDYKTIHDLICYPKGYLPKAIIESVLDLYAKKTELKGVKGKETEYFLSKGMLNSVYGMMVTDIVKDNIIYEYDNWEIEKVNSSDEIDKYNKKRSRFLFYPWGVWVTAYARQNLWLGILELKNDYIYSDTDSLKFINYEKHKKFFDDYNAWVEQKQIRTLKHYNIDIEKLYPKTIHGKIKISGVWDYEGKYNRFKTLGAKRYLYEQNNQLHLTVAGLSKVNGLNYMKRGRTNSEVFNFFNDEMLIPSNETGKNTHTYIDSVKTALITDYRGFTKEIETLSSVHLEPAEYGLSLNKMYVDFYKLIQKGFIYRGVIR